MPDQPYTDDDVRLVSAAIASQSVSDVLRVRSMARAVVAQAVLDALTAAGWRDTESYDPAAAWFRVECADPDTPPGSHIAVVDFDERVIRVAAPDAAEIVLPGGFEVWTRTPPEEVGDA